MVRFRRQALHALQRQDRRQRPLELANPLRLRDWLDLLQAPVQRLLQSNNSGVFTPVLLQQDPTECGAVCLAIVLGFFQRSVPRPELLRACGVSRNGADAAHLVTAARRFGMEARGFRMGLERLKQITLPAVLFWQFNHFVVLEAITDRDARINDPAAGRRLISIDDFDRDYTGIVITLQPDADDARSMHLDHPAAWLWRKRSPHRLHRPWMDLWPMAPVVGLMIGAPVVLSQGSDTTLLWLMSITLAWLFLSKRIDQLCRVMQQHGERQVERQLLELPSWVVDQQFTSSLVRPLSAWSEIRQILESDLVPLMPLIISGPFWAIQLMAGNRVVGVITVTVLIIHGMLLLRAEEWTTSHTNQTRRLASKSAALLHQNLRESSTVKALGLESDLIEGWTAREVTAALQEQDREHRHGAISWMLVSLRWGLPMLVVIQAPNSSKDTLIGLCIAASLQAQQRITRAWTTARINIGRLQALEQLPCDPLLSHEDKRVELSTPWKPASVTLENVSFSHIPGDKPIIGPLNLTVQPGEHVAIQGPSGCGKTTLLRLMAGLLQPDQGDILIDGHPLKSYQAQQRPNIVALVEQIRPTLRGRLRDCIAPWNRTISDTTIVDVLEEIGLDQRLHSLPDGLETSLTDMSTPFSVSEQQLLHLAKALLHQPRLLLLDEATSALDADQETKIKSLLRQRGQTTISINHWDLHTTTAEQILNLSHR